MNKQPIDIISPVVEGIQDKKGTGIVILDLSDIEGAGARNFVICQATNPTQVAAVADSVRDNVLKTAGRKPLSSDGYRNASWIILDYGDYMIHIFLPDERRRYNLEELWSDARFTEIPDLD